MKNLEDALSKEAMDRIVNAMEHFDPDTNEKDKAIYARIVKDNFDRQILENKLGGSVRSEQNHMRSFNMV